MKKFFTILSMIVAVFALSSCETGGFVWNLTATATGNGNVVVSYPTGNLTTNGSGTVTATTSSDTTSVNAVLLENVLGATSDYDKKTVKFAQEVNEEFDSAFAVDVLEGEWSVDIEGYAKEPNTGLYIVIKKHWPEKPAVEEVLSDSTEVVVAE